MHEVTAYDDLLVLIKNGFGNTCYLNRLRMLNLAPHCFVFQVWYAGLIDILSHSDILSKDWKVLQDVIVDGMNYLLYWMTSDVL